MSLDDGGVGDGDGEASGGSENGKVGWVGIAGIIAGWAGFGAAPAGAGRAGGFRTVPAAGIRADRWIQGCGGRPCPG
jgi:hypothetical protein